MGKELAIKKYNLAATKEMVTMASVLKNHVVKHQLYTPIAGKNYVHVEGWQFAGGLMGTFPRVVSITNQSAGNEVKYLAEVEVVELKTEKIISRGFAVCSNKESKKKSFDEYAVLSMAQTRAIGKAYRNVVGWVMKLAGYESTPLEEMSRVGETAPKAEPVADVVPEPQEPEYLCAGLTKSGCGVDLTKQEHDYSMKMYGKPLCREHQKGAKPVKK